MSDEMLKDVVWLKFQKGQGTEIINPMNIVGLYDSPGESKVLRFTDGSYTNLSDEQLEHMLELIGEMRNV